MNPGAPFSAVPAVVPSAAGAAACDAAGFVFVDAGVTLSPGGAVVVVVDAAGAFVAVTAGVPNHPGGYVPSPPLLPEGVAFEPTSAKVQR